MALLNETHAAFPGDNGLSILQAHHQNTDSSDPLAAL
jgi:hypothetical protein